MNLWAKSYGRLAFFAVALFFFSCESEDSFLGFPNPNDKFNVTQVEIPLTSSVLAIDSIVSDNIDAASAQGSVVLVGDYLDNLVGHITSEAFVQIFPSNSTKIPADAIFDSLTVQFRLNFYGYGFNGQRTQRFSIHEITGDSISVYSVPRKRYWYSDKFTYDPIPLAETSVSVNYDYLRKELDSVQNQQDTILAEATLPQSFAQRIFNQAVQNDFSDNAQRKQFLYNIKGLALVPAEMEGVIGLRILDGLSKITIHYRTLEDGAVKDTLDRSYFFTNSSFSNVTADRSVSELSAITQPYQSFQPPSGRGYVQSGAPVVTKLDLSNFYQFADQDSNTNLIINEAALIIDGVESAPGLDPHASMVLKVMSNTNGDQFARSNNPTDSAAISGYRVISGGHYFVLSDQLSSQPTPATVDYNSDNDQYVSYVTLFTQNMFRLKDQGDLPNENRIKFLGIQALSPGLSTSVTRTVFNGNSIRLRIKYTRPTNSTP